MNIPDTLEEIWSTSVDVPDPPGLVRRLAGVRNGGDLLRLIRFLRSMAYDTPGRTFWLGSLQLAAVAGCSAAAAWRRLAALRRLGVIRCVERGGWRDGPDGREKVASVWEWLGTVHLSISAA